MNVSRALCAASIMGGPHHRVPSLPFHVIGSTGILIVNGWKSFRILFEEGRCIGIRWLKGSRCVVIPWALGQWHLEVN